VYQFFLKHNRLSLSLTTILLLTWVSTSGQNSRVIDSLRFLINQKSDTSRCSLHVDISFEYVVSSKYDEALKAADDGYACAKENSDSLTIVRAGRFKGQILRRMDRLTEAVEIFSEVLPIAKRNGFAKEYKLILNSLAVSYTFLGNYDFALRYHFESLIIRESEGDKQGLSVSYNNIGLVYYKIKNYEKALEYYKKSLAIKDEIGDKLDLDLLLINIGLCYINSKDFSTAQNYMMQALSLCKDACKDEIAMIGKIGLGMAFFGQGKWDEAKTYFEESLSLANKTNDKRYQAENTLYLARILLTEKSYDEAGNLFKQSEEIANALGYTELQLSIYKEYASLFDVRQDYKNASIYQKKYFTLKDSIYNDQLIRNLAAVQTNYEERENLKTIADKDAVLKLKEDLIQRQKAQYAFVIIITFLIVGLAGVLYWANNRQRISNKDLASAKNEIEEKNKELAQKNLDLDRQVIERTEELNLANESLQQVNNELDNFIYKTSHDIRGPLATLKGMCNLAIMEINEPLALDYLKKLDFTAEKMNTILTRLLIINQINSSILEPNMIDFKFIIEEILTLERKKGLPPNFSFSYQIEPGYSYFRSQPGADCS
jgi:Bacteriophytochrome (light-regulated signal transduction histidine kinase)